MQLNLSIIDLRKFKSSVNQRGSQGAKLSRMRTKRIVATISIGAVFRPNNIRRHKSWPIQTISRRYSNGSRIHGPSRRKALAQPGKVRPRQVFARKQQGSTSVCLYTVLGRSTQLHRTKVCSNGREGLVG